MDDQHNAHAMSCAGHKLVETPNIDRLAKEGTRFPAAFTQAGQCCPSRYTTWTGRYPRSHGLRWNGMHENKEELTIFEILHAQGYVTGTVGKHHMLSPLQQHGFDFQCDMRDYFKFVSQSPNSDVRAGMNHGEFDPALEGIFGKVGTLHQDNEHHKDGFFATQGLQFIERNADVPWCLWMSFFGPHTPITPSEPWASSIDPKQVELPPSVQAATERAARGELGPLMKRWKHCQQASPDVHAQVMAAYLGYVEQIDYNIGRILDQLDRLGLAERTIVVFTSDHGDLMGEHGAWRKGVFGYDATLRVPMILRGPGTAQGQVRPELVGLVDLVPTVLDWVGTPIPSNVQGKSMLELLRGHDSDWRRWIVSETGLRGLRSGHSLALRTERYKYVRTELGEQVFEELFDLTLDPWETENCLDRGGYRGIAADLAEQLGVWEATTESAPVYPIVVRQERRPAGR
ncbi:MAG: arylsulfatase A-like enzyme [Planctomycetota bacterium]|jgi:arylsulfatase A-like enzyme